MTIPFSSAKWIWLPQEEPVVNQYVNFRRVFTIGVQPATAMLHLSVDTDFVLFVNGEEAARGQFSDYPERKTFTSVDVAGKLRAGENVIAVLAYYKGRNFSTYCAGKAGLIFALEAGEACVVSDGAWRARQSPAFRSGEMPVVTVQLGFTAEFDARLEDAWTESGYDHNGWMHARELAGATDGFWTELLPRPVPPLNVLPPRPAKLAAQGGLIRRGEGFSVADTMMRDALIAQRQYEAFTMPPRPDVFYTRAVPLPDDFIVQPDEGRAELLPPEEGTDGRYVIVDVGREEAGLLTFHLDAPAGTVVDIAHGEHLHDGRVRAQVGGRNFADRYICREGDNRFTLPRRLGLRYLEFHFTNYDRPLQLDYLGLLPTELPLDDAGSFTSTDALANRIYEVGKRTLALCMHEHYEDCPWREQSLYAGDSRNQALFGYYAFGNYDFAAASFDLLGRGVGEDGLLELTAPASTSVNIPGYTVIWITELAEHWLYSGNPVLFDTFSQQIEWMLNTALAAHFDSVTGLYQPPGGPRAWQLYEWMDGLAGFKFGNDEPGERFDAPYNLYLHEALRSYAWMLAQAGQAEKATAVEAQYRALDRAIREAFWDAKEGALATFLERGKHWHHCDLVQAMAFSEGLLPESCADRALEGLMARRWYPMTFYTLLYQTLGLRTLGPAARRFTAETIVKHWEPMLLANATSFWETDLSDADFADAGSLCHAWSALPVYYYGAWTLGVRPLTPGFARFAVSPYPDRFLQASGAIPTPAGPIRIAWTRTDAGLNLVAEGPTGLQPVLQPFPEAPVARATYNSVEFGR